MFLTFLSMSFVALALFSSAMSFGSDFLTVAAVVLAFDVVLGLATYGRIAAANVDDLRALHGMARVRHAYTQIAPMVEPYFTTATHDDLDSVLTAYGTLPSTSSVRSVRAHDVGRDDRTHHVDGRRGVRGCARAPRRHLRRLRSGSASEPGSSCLARSSLFTFGAVTGIQELLGHLPGTEGGGSRGTDKTPVVPPARASWTSVAGHPALSDPIS